MRFADESCGGCLNGSNWDVLFSNCSQGTREWLAGEPDEVPLHEYRKLISVPCPHLLPYLVVLWVYVCLCVIVCVCMMFLRWLKELSLHPSETNRKIETPPTTPIHIKFTAVKGSLTWKCRCFLSVWWE